MNPNRIFPVGTRVVSRVPVRDAAGSIHPDGAVGAITKSPLDHTHGYRIRFVDGFEATLRRTEFALLTDFMSGSLSTTDPLRDRGLFDDVIFRCVIGSTAYGLDQSDSDVDRRGIYLPSADAHWSLYGVPEQLENDATQECYWELQKFVVLALKANPNVLECLYSPIVELCKPPADELVSMRGVFLSRIIYQTYNGYIQSQFKKIEVQLRNHGTIKWKHAMHLIRLLLAGITAVREGFIPVRVDEHRDRLLFIRRGEMPWNEIDAWRGDLHRDFERAYETTALPERPDYERVNAFLIRARRLRAEESA